MSLFSLNKVSLSFGDQVIFREANFSLDEGEKVSLIGRNGSGKSTLFRLILQEIAPDEGELLFQTVVNFAKLDQALPADNSLSVRGFVKTGLAKQEALIERYKILSANNKEKDNLVELEKLQRRIEALGGWDIETQTSQIISSLNLPEAAKLGDLSGGWQRRVSLAKALVSCPDVLLLDEPTNHLDLEAVEWLENRVKSFKGSVIFITHDRKFLQQLATRIVDIDRGILRSWPGDYKKYIILKQKAFSEEEKSNALFDKHLNKEEEWIRKGIKARRTRNEGRVRSLEKLREERASRIKPDNSARIVIQKATLSSKKVIEARKISFSFNSKKRLIKNISVKIMKGDRVALIGNNGVGKSTLLKLLIGQLQPNDGSIKFADNLNIGYFDQRREYLDPQKTVAEIVGDGQDYIEINGRPRHVIGYLKGFLFSPSRSMTPIKILSGGEQNRVILAKLLTKPANLLVLDEPTNDLDVETLEVLEKQLQKYTGTLLIVSHDREFLDNVATSTLVFESSGNIEGYPGGYSDWLKKGRKLSTKEAIITETQAIKTQQGEEKSRKKKLSYKLNRELEMLPDRISALESKIARLNTQMENPSFYEKPYKEQEPVLGELNALTSQLDEAIARWTELETISSSV